jgi:hypothetical protein
MPINSIAQSTASKTPWFGRAWTLKVKTQQGQELFLSNSAWEPESLRVTFAIEQVALQKYRFADISIYNLNTTTEQLLLQSGGITSLHHQRQYGHPAG